MSIHPTAIVSDGARLGADVRVGPYAVIEPDVSIGAGSEIRAHAVVKRFTSLGEANTIHEGAVLGGEPQDLAFNACESYVRTGPRCTIREGVTIHRGTQADSTTVIGAD